MAKTAPNELIEKTMASSLFTNRWMVVNTNLDLALIRKAKVHSCSHITFTRHCQLASFRLSRLNRLQDMQWHLWINDHAIGRGYTPFNTVNIAVVAWEPAPSWHSMPKNFSAL